MGHWANLTYDGSCVCLDSSCVSDDAELKSLGFGKMAIYDRECVKVPSGTCGKAKCDMDSGASQLIAKLWTCRSETFMMGTLLCAQINALICTLQCAEAASACLTNPGGPECSQELESCAQCLTSEGIDCGCLTVACFYNEPRDEIWGETWAAYGATCSRP